MNNNSKIFLIIIVLIVLILIVVLSANVGGIAIRNNVTSVDQVTLGLSEPIMRGVPVMVHWNTADTTAKKAVTVWLRDSQGEKAVGQSTLNAGTATIIAPCDSIGSANALIIRDSTTRSILATKEVTLLPPGPECVR